MIKSNNTELAQNIVLIEELGLGAGVGPAGSSWWRCIDEASSMKRCLSRGLCCWWVVVGG